MGTEKEGGHPKASTKIPFDLRLAGSEGVSQRRRRDEQVPSPHAGALLASVRAGEVMGAQRSPRGRGWGGLGGGNVQLRGGGCGEGAAV